MPKKKNRSDARGGENGPSIQVGALPVRCDPDGTPRVLLVTSRETKRWVIPKGWPIKGLNKPRSAEKEAREEAGVRGKIRRKPLGTYHYMKRLTTGLQACEVWVYRLDVEGTLRSWREQGQRDLVWFSVADAAQRVEEPGLAALIRALEPIPAAVPPVVRAEGRVA